MKKLFYILCCSLAVLFTACDKGEPNSPEDSKDPAISNKVETGASSNVTKSSAILKGVVNVDILAYQKIEFGIMYSTSSKTISNRSAETKKGEKLMGKNFEVKLSNLKSKTKYYYCAYLLLNEMQYEFGEMKEFITKSSTEDKEDDYDPAKRKLYFVNKAGWTDVKAYIWSAKNENYNIAWPGESAYIEDYRINGYEVYSYDMSDKQLYDMIIFNGSDTSTSTVLSQTSDLEIDYSKPYYYDGIWFSSLDDIVGISGYHNGYAYVDLGLPSGIKWATMNVGATSPQGIGYKFAWGETKPKSFYDWSNYCVNNAYGTEYDKMVLELSDDAANANWGGDWRMPTKKEQSELTDDSYTTWTWTTQKGCRGYKITSNINGNSIFLPAGYCNSDENCQRTYWTSSAGGLENNHAYQLFISRDVPGTWFFSMDRYLDRCVRPVLP